MTKEYERRYVCDPEIIKSLGSSAVVIRQGYFIAEKDKQIRVRVEEGGMGFITVKLIQKPEERDEYQYTIPNSDAKALYEAAQYKLTKTRYTLVNIPGIISISIDRFADNVCIAEIETSEPVTLSSLPKEYMPFLKSEVTNTYRYSNYYYAGVPEQTK